MGTHQYSRNAAGVQTHELEKAHINKWIGLDRNSTDCACFFVKRFAAEKNSWFVRKNERPNVRTNQRTNEEDGRVKNEEPKEEIHGERFYFFCWYKYIQQYGGAQPSYAISSILDNVLQLIYSNAFGFFFVAFTSSMTFRSLFNSFVIFSNCVICFFF